MLASVDKICFLRVTNWPKIVCLSNWSVHVCLCVCVLVFFCCFFVTGLRRIWSNKASWQWTTIWSTRHSWFVYKLCVCVIVEMSVCVFQRKIEVWSTGWKWAKKKVLRQGWQTVRFKILMYGLPNEISTVSVKLILRGNDCPSAVLLDNCYRESCWFCASDRMSHVCLGICKCVCMKTVSSCWK